MNEIKRILGNYRILIGLVLILFINGFLFVREQVSNNYGMNLSLPQSSISVSLDNGYDMHTEKADAKETYNNYRKWLEKVDEMPVSDAVCVLEQEKYRLENIFKNQENSDADVKSEYAAINTLLSQAEYLTEYPAWLNSIQNNKNNMLAFSIFNNPDSFSQRNILKTAEEFENLNGVKLSLGANGAIESLLGFSLTDWFLLIVLMIISISFLEERKKGLWNVVYAASGGRIQLALKRKSILFFTSAFSVLLLYGTNLVIGFSIYGGYESLNRSIQSVELLGGLSLLSTIGGFLIQWFLMRIIAAFFISLLLWLILTAVRNVKYTILITGGILALEYGLYTFLPVQSGFNLFKYFNLFTYISMSDLYTNYLNINLFGYPFGIRRISQIALIPLCVTFGIICVFINCKKRPAEGKDLLGKFAIKINGITDKILGNFRMLGFEAYKTFWIQKGIVMIALFLYLAPQFSYTTPVPVSNATESAARQYTAELAGKITAETFANIEKIREELNRVISDYEKAKNAYENNEMEFPQFDVFAREASDAQIKIEGLNTVQNRVEQLENQARNEGFTPFLIAEAPFESVYGQYGENNRQSAAMLSLLILGLLLAGCMTCEKQSGMIELTTSTVRGRRVLLTRKIMLAAVCAIFVWAVVYGLELCAFLQICDIETLSTSSRNLALLENFPFSCKIGTAIIFLYSFRLITMFCVAVITLLISSFIKRIEAAYIAVLTALLLPSLLYSYMGLVSMKYLSLSVPLSAIPLIQSENPIVSLCFAAFFLIALTGASFHMLNRVFRIK